MALTRPAILKTAVRLGVSAILVLIAVTVAERSGFDGIDSWPGPWALVAAAALWFVAILSMGPRIQLLARSEKVVISSATALRLTLEGHALGQVSPGLVGGDIWRAIRLARLGLTSASAVRVVATDRIVGLVGLAILAGIAWTPLIASRVDWGRAAALIAALLALFALGGWLWRRAARLPTPFPGSERGLRSLRHLMRVAPSPTDLLLLIALAVTGHIANSAAFLIIGTGLGLHVSVMNGLAILSVAFFLAAMPIAFGGWGAREAAVAAGFIAIGQAPALPVATSIVYGLLLLVGSIPGLALVLAEPLGRRAPRA